jgi:hypothetical protein
MGNEYALRIAGTEPPTPPRPLYFARFGDTWLGEDNTFKVQTISIEKANVPEVVTDDEGNILSEKDVFLVHYVLRDGVNKRVMRTFESLQQAEEYVLEFLHRIGVVTV